MVAAVMANEPFFRKDGDLFVPTRAGVGPWDPNSLHGRVIIGLLGAQIEARHGSPEYMPARLTVDMYKLPDLSPVEVVTRTVKDGYRIKVIDAEFISGGVSAGRATCQLLRKTENAPGNVLRPAIEIHGRGATQNSSPISRIFFHFGRKRYRIGQVISRISRRDATLIARFIEDTGVIRSRILLVSEIRIILRPA